MSTDDLISWLNVQLDEDELLAKNTAYGSERESGEWHVDGRYIFDVATGSRVSGDIEDLEHEIAHVCRHDPARVLRDVAAKRAIIDAHQRITAQSAENGEELAGRLLRGANWLNDEWAIKQNQLRVTGWQLEGYVRASRYVLLCLALAYADRPGYRDEWRLG